LARLKAILKIAETHDLHLGAAARELCGGLLLVSLRGGVALLKGGEALVPLFCAIINYDENQNL
jgi:hypothetical protein